MKNIAEELAHPTESREFLEHMLYQTKRVERLGKCLRKLGWVTGIVAAFFFVCSAF